MKKLMIGQINMRYNMFLNNTCNLNVNRFLMNVRSAFKDHFGSAKEYYEQLKREDKKIHNGPSYHKSRTLMTTYFNIKGYKAGSIIVVQDQNKPKGRSLKVKMIRYDDSKKEMDMVPFIRFHCNPEGIYILEKIWFDSIV